MQEGKEKVHLHPNSLHTIHHTPHRTLTREDLRLQRQLQPRLPASRALLHALQRLPSQHPRSLRPHLHIDQQIRHTLPLQQLHPPAAILPPRKRERRLKRRSRNTHAHGAHQRGTRPKRLLHHLRALAGRAEQIRLRHAQVREARVRARGGREARELGLREHRVGARRVGGDHVSRDDEDQDLCCGILLGRGRAAGLGEAADDALEVGSLGVPAGRVGCPELGRGERILV